MKKHSYALVIAALALLGALLPTGAAHAVSGGGGTPFAVAPVVQPDGSARSYFTLEGRAGQVLEDQVVITNSAKSTEHLSISAARGATAPNSGSVFAGAFAPCTGTGCWITGLPDDLSLAGGESRALPFQVHIPADAADQQYLAGVTVRPADAGAPVTVGEQDGSKAQAIIINEVTVGVAVTVGTDLSTALAVTGVTGSTTGPTSLLHVAVRNPGQMFVRGTGRVDCTGQGKDLHYPVTINTVLPGDPANVQVTAEGLPAGPAQCSVVIPFGAGTARWHGSVEIPRATVVKRVQVAPGVYAAVPPNRVPTWARVLIGIGAGVIVALVGTVIVLLVRRRNTPAAPAGA